MRQNAHVVEETEEDRDKASKLLKRLMEAKQHAWRRWRHEYIHSVMESHRVNRKTAPVPGIGENVLVMGDEKNRGKWKKGRVLHHVRERDVIIRVVTLLHKGHHFYRPLSLVCPLENKGPVQLRTHPCSRHLGVNRLRNPGTDDKQLRPLRRNTTDYSGLE